MGITSFAQEKTMPDGGVFDAEYYAANNPDVVAALGTDENVLYQHYLNFGKKEGRLPYANAAATATVQISNYETEELMAAWGYKYIVEKEATHINSGTLVINRIYKVTPDKISGEKYTLLWAHVQRRDDFSNAVMIEYSFVNKYERTQNNSTLVGQGVYRNIVLDQYEVGKKNYYSFCSDNYWASSNMGTDLDINNVLEKYNSLQKGTFIKATSKNANIYYADLYE
jgi:hypothetical protein